MLKLQAFHIKPLSEVTEGKMVARLSANPNLPTPLRSKEILLISDNCPTELPKGFRAYFILGDSSNIQPEAFEIPNVFRLPADQYYLSDGDVVKFDTEKLALKTLYRRQAKQNALLVTERCNNYCLMCSQPPRDIDDRYIVEELLEAIPLMSKDNVEIGITGGEPTLLGDDLVRILRTLKNYLPDTAIHILSNGRNFKDLKLAQKIAALDHLDLMIGIPLYSDISNIHDYVVQADGAFDETLQGIINLKRCGVKVEIRVVIHKQTDERLPQLAEFITRNLLFVDHVALMGLEMMGFTKANINDLWIDPIEYQPQLVEAVETLARFKMHVSVYNHQLCLLDKQLWPFNVKSISDWKNDYMPECAPCLMKEQCGGFFSSAVFKYSSHIAPFQEVITDSNL
jgi:His-Xaa-Ser system radical SAM maturase HxsC